MDRVRTPGGPGRDGSRVDHHLVPLDLHREPEHPSGCRAQLVLARVVVLGAVAGALEPLALLAERHPAAQVGALLVDGHEAPREAWHFGGDPLVDPTRLVAVAGITDEVEAPRAEVVRLLTVIDLLQDLVWRIRQDDLRTESSLQVRPQEGQVGAAELRGEHAQRRKQASPEEVAATQHSGRPLWPCPEGASV